MKDPLQPSPSLLAKLGSIIVHADEFFSPTGHDFDLKAINGLLSDPEVAGWIRAMDELSLLPKKRS